MKGLDETNVFGGFRELLLVAQIGFIMHHTAVSSALQEMNFGYGREALQFVHSEDQGTVHHAMDQESVLLGINVREMFLTQHQEMVSRGRDGSDRILKRSQISKSCNVRDSYAVCPYGGLETRTPAVAQILDLGVVRSNAPPGGGFVGGACFAARERYRSHGQAGQGRTSLQKSSTIRLLGTHSGTLLSEYFG